MRKFTFTCCLFLITALTFAQTYLNPAAPVEDRVKDLLPRMTLTEKIDYIGGFNSFYIESISRLGTPLIKMSDGPVGVRNYGNTTAYPAGIMAAATWNTDLINQEGIALGKDARARGVHILLGPGVNIYRAPMCGRNFEYYGEDPYLSGQMAAAYINGVQSQGVVATVKHFDANNQEWDRYNVSSDMDERTLQEIYLPAFKSAVKTGHAGCVMNSYNLVNGVHCSQNNHLLNEILKDDWGFDGFVMSDWGSTWDGLAAAEGGLDLEMPSGDHMNTATLIPAINNGTLSESVINDKVSRILRILFRFGFFDHVQQDGSIPLNNPDNSAVALNIAREGIVLLKDQDSILPLDRSKISKIAVIGTNANTYLAGGGSSYTSPFSSVTILQGIQNKAGAGITVDYSGGTSDYATIANNSVFYTGPGSTTSGLTGEYFNNQTLTGTATYTRTDQHIDFHWSGLPNVPNLPADHFSIRWTGIVKPAVTGTYTFYVRGDDGFRLYVNNNLIIDDWQDQAATVKTASVNLQANTENTIKLEYYENAGDAEITFGYYNEQSVYTDAMNAASGADVAIVCVGFNSNTEGEGFDRPFVLPDNQDSLINAVASVNPNTIVIVNAGGNVSMTSWIDHVKGLLHAWYPGQNGGTAIAEVLFGDVNPSGKLPASFEKKWEDNPTYNSYYDPDHNNRVTYSEGLLLGYRYYDTDSIEPMFPFGFGLSYTTFEYSNLNVVPGTQAGGAGATLTFDVENTGTRAGAEAAQVYVHQIDAPVMRPLKELKGFKKVFLNPGEKETLTVDLDSSAFAYYKTEQNGFGMDHGDFVILIGASSRDIRLTDTLSLEPQALSDLDYIALDPENNSTEASPDQQFKITFSRTVNFETGKHFVVKDYSNGNVVENIASDKIHGFGSATLFFSASNPLQVGKEYYIEVDSAAVIDYYGNSFAGIQSEDKWNFTIAQPTVLQDNITGKISIYPVPANDFVYFALSGNVDKQGTVEITTIGGQLLTRMPLSELLNQGCRYNCSNLPNGLYICKITTTNKVMTSKFIISR